MDRLAGQRAAEKQILTFQSNVSFIFSSSCVSRLMDSNLLGVSLQYFFATPSWRPQLGYPL